MGEVKRYGMRIANAGTKTKERLVVVPTEENGGTWVRNSDHEAEIKRLREDTIDECVLLLRRKYDEWADRSYPPPLRLKELIDEVDALSDHPAPTCVWTPIKGGMTYRCSCDGRQRGEPFSSENWNAEPAEYETDLRCSGCGLPIEIKEAPDA